MKRTNRDFKIAILTTPSGVFTAHHLVKNLNIVGIIIDRYKRDIKTDKISIWEKLYSIKIKRGWKGILSTVMNKFFTSIDKPLAVDNISKAIKVQDKYFKKLDDIFFGYPYYQKRPEYRNFVKWDDLADYYDAPIVYVENINDASSAKILREWDVDLGIIVGGRIIKPHIIQIPRLGIINGHSSILPRHRGLESEYWCLYYEHFDSLGVTVHYVEPGLDSGNIIVQKKMRFEKGDTPTSLRFKADIIGREAIVEAVKIIETTETKGTPQNEELATRNKRPTLQTDKELYSKLPRLWAQYGE